MRTLVKSMKRLYDAEKVTREQVKERVANEIITPEEYEDITGEMYDG